MLIVGYGGNNGVTMLAGLLANQLVSLSHDRWKIDLDPILLIVVEDALHVSHISVPNTRVLNGKHLRDLSRVTIMVALLR